MVALSPRFAFLAMLCSLTAISMAPLSEAAVLQLRTSNPSSMGVKSNIVHTRRRVSTSHDHYAMSTDSRADPQKEDKIYAPLLRMPKSADVPSKNKTNAGADSGGSGGESDRKSGDGSEGDESKHVSHGDQGLVSKKELAKDKGRRWNLSRPMNQLKDFLGEKMLSDYRYVRSPDHHHHHHHHHHHDRRRRSRMNWGSENGRIVSKDNEHIVHLRSPYYHHSSHEKVIASGKRDHVVIRRSPHHYHHDHHGHHHDYHHDGYEEVDVSGNNDDVRVSRSPHNHHHHEDKNIVVSGSDDHVHVHRSVSIAGEQGQSYIVPHAAKRALAQKSFSLSSLGKRSGDINGARGHIDIVSPTAESEPKRLASLFLTPSDSTLDNRNFVLNASEKNSTEVYVIPTPSEYDTMFVSDEMGATIRMAMFDMASATISQYCATFDPNPSAPSPLKAQKCTNNPVGEHQSQLFAYNRHTGIVRPMWFDSEIDGTGSEKGDCSVDAPPTPQNASMAGATEADTKNMTSTPSTTPATTGNSTVLPADTPQAAPSNTSGSTVSGVQKVALVFVAADPEVLDNTSVVATSTSSVLATSTGAGASDNVASTTNSPSTTPMAGSSSGTLAATSPAVLATASGSSSVSVSALPSSASGAAISAPAPNGTPSSLPSSAAATKSTLPTVLGVQVVPTTEGNPSTPNPSVTPVMTPVSTEPYEWMFKPNSRP